MFATHMAAMNAARKQLGKGWKEFAEIEKLGAGEFSLQINKRGGLVLNIMGEARCSLIEAIASLEKAEAKREYQELKAAQAQAELLANQQQSEVTLPNGKIWIKVSSIPKPTKQVWHIADEMLKAALDAGKDRPSRKEVQDECVRRGIASGTARTQYQAWKACNDEMAGAVRANLPQK